MKIVQATKMIAGLAASAGTGKIIGNIVVAVTPDDVSKFTKVLITIGTGAIGGMVGKQVAKSVEDDIDGMVEMFDMMFGKEETSEV